jgi:hypothetical protein
MAILSGLAYIPIAYGVPEGDAKNAKVVNTGLLNWAASSFYLLDPTQNNQLLTMQSIQSVFIDNYNSTGTTWITVAGTGHIVRVAPKSQAWLPLLAGDRPVLTIQNSSANGNSQLWLCNVPAIGGTWTLP